MQERMTALESNCKIELVNVTKRFGKVIANDSVNLTIEGGKVLCLLGENGSGKTTLMNVLSGIYMPEQGHILKNGVEIQIRSPKDAFANGIGMIHQHFKLVDVLTVTENIILGLNEKGKLNIRAAAQKIDDICKNTVSTSIRWPRSMIFPSRRSRPSRSSRCCSAGLRS